MLFPESQGCDAMLLQYSDLVLKLRDLHHAQASNRYYRYLYNQSFYGFAGFLDPLVSTGVSERAHEQYEIVRQRFPAASLPTDMREVTWDLQSKFDKGRKVFHLEHIYTGDMFRKAVKAISASQELAQFVRTNYRLAWILKAEDQDLNRSGYRSRRGNTLGEALNAYEKCGIRLRQSRPDEIGELSLAQ